MHTKRMLCSFTVVTALLFLPLTSAQADDIPGEAGNDDLSVLNEHSVLGKLVKAADSANSLSTPSIADLSEEIGIPTSGPGSLHTVGADISVSVKFDPEQQDSVVTALGRIGTVEEVLSITPVITFTVAIDRLQELETIPGVHSVSPNTKPSVGVAPVVTEQNQKAVQADGGFDVPDCGERSTEAEGPLHADTARDRFKVDGTGMTIGIISDSFDTASGAITNANEDVLLGALPGPSNPCGFEQPVEVLVDYNGENSTDEGRGMAQLVHGIAPGAKIVFAQGYEGPNKMAETIVDLANAGADIIVDDLVYYDEPYFQEGIVSYAIRQVQSQGVTYLTAAGNDTARALGGTHEGAPVGAWRTSAYHPTECPEWVESPIEGDDGASPLQMDCLDFDPSGAGVPYDEIKLAGFGIELPPASIVTSTGQPYGFAMPTCLATQLYESTVEGHELLAQSTPYDDSPNSSLSFTPESGQSLALVVTRYWDDDPNAEACRKDQLSNPPVWIGSLGILTKLIVDRHFATTAGDHVVGFSSHGHQADGSAIPVATADWATPTEVTGYTSLGAGLLTLQPYDPASSEPAEILPNPLLAPTSRITSVDGTSTTFFGEADESSGAWRFHGTSAAAPNAAAALLLGKAYYQEADSQSLVDTFMATANLNMANPYSNFGFDAIEVTGAGLVDTEAFLANLPVAPTVGLRASAADSSTVTATWTKDKAPDHYRIALLSDGAVVDEDNLEMGTNEYSFKGLKPETSYQVSVTATNAAGKPAEAITSEIVKTPAKINPPNPSPTPTTPIPTTQDPNTAIAIPAKAALASTGGSIGPILWIAGAVLTLGIGSTVAGRRRAQSRHS